MNVELPIYDSAYATGHLTLSMVGQNYSKTFCAGCHVGIVTAGDGSGFNSPERQLLASKLGHQGTLASQEWTGPSLHGEARTNCSGVAVHSTLVVGCADGTKQYAVAGILSWLQEAHAVTIDSENVWYFDDRENNIAPFEGTGFNARMVSCNTREGPIGFCGAIRSEIIATPGIALCPSSSWAGMH